MRRSEQNRLKIAILGSRGYPSTYGGFETFVRHLAPTLAEHGHEVTVYCRFRPDGVIAKAWRSGQVRCIWTPGTDSKVGSTLSFGLTSHLDASLRDYDAALVMNVANGYFVPLLRARGIPVVLNTDGLEWQRGKWGPTAKRIFYTGAKLSTRYADVLISDSQHLAHTWRDEFGVEPRFIPYGAEVTQAIGAEKVSALGIRPHSYALVVARLVPENNVDLTLDALDLVPDVPAVVVGAANYRSPLEDRLSRLNSQGRVRWLGHVHDQRLLTQLWANSGVYVHGHSVGGTNPALLQAMGAGAPTLALDTPFNSEVVQNVEQLYPHDPQMLSGAIWQVLSTPRLREQLRSHGRRRIAQDYGWDQVTNAYEAALRAAAATTATATQI